MDSPAFWAALAAIVTAIGSALVSYLQTKPKIDALQFQINLLKEADVKKDKMLAECEQKHNAIQGMLFKMIEGKIGHGMSTEVPPPGTF